VKTKFLTTSEIELLLKFDDIKKLHKEENSNLVFVKCITCKGTGLAKYGDIWINNGYCDYCNGFGGEFILKDLVIKCDKCDGLDKECSKCGGSYYVNWLENIVGKRIQE